MKRLFSCADIKFSNVLVGVSVVLTFLLYVKGMPFGASIFQAASVGYFFRERLVCISSRSDTIKVKPKASEYISLNLLLLCGECFLITVFPQLMILVHIGDSYTSSPDAAQLLSFACMHSVSTGIFILLFSFLSFWKLRARFFYRGFHSWPPTEDEKVMYGSQRAKYNIVLAFFWMMALCTFIGADDLMKESISYLNATNFPDLKVVTFGMVYVNACVYPFILSLVLGLMTPLPGIASSKKS